MSNIMLGIRSQTLRMKAWGPSKLLFYLVRVGSKHHITYSCRATISKKNTPLNAAYLPQLLSHTLRYAKTNTSKGEGLGQGYSLTYGRKIEPSSGHFNSTIVSEPVAFVYREVSHG